MVASEPPPMALLQWGTLKRHHTPPPPPTSEQGLPKSLAALSIAGLPAGLRPGGLITWVGDGAGEGATSCRGVGCKPQYFVRVQDGVWAAPQDMGVLAVLTWPPHGSGVSPSLCSPLRGWQRWLLQAERRQSAGSTWDSAQPPGGGLSPLVMLRLGGGLTPILGALAGMCSQQREKAGTVIRDREYLSIR